MSAELVAALIKDGTLGVIIVALCVALQRVYTRNDEIQKSRVDDAKAAQAQLLEVMRQVVAAITQSTHAAEAQRDAMAEVRQTLKEMADDLRRNPTLPRR